MVVEFTEAGFTREDFKHIVVRHPKIFGLSFQHNILPKLLFLQELRATAAGEVLSEDEIRRLDVKYPMVLGLSLANIESKLKYLVDELQREGREILTCPAYLASSMESKIVPRARYLQALGLNQKTYTLSSLYSDSDARFCQRLKTDEQDFIAFKHSLCGNYSRGPC